jgi:hypothetical protein
MILEMISKEVEHTQLSLVQPEDSEEELKDLAMSDIFDRKEREGSVSRRLRSARLRLF